MATRKSSKRKSLLPPRASYTQISTFQRCKTRYYWRYLAGLERVTPALGLYRGSMLHKAYDAYMFQERASHDIAYGVVERMAQEALNTGDISADLINQTADEALACLRHYLPWADENDDWTLVVPENAVECEITGEIPVTLHDGTSHLFVFKLDALVQRGDQLFLLENKFRKNLDASGLEHDMQTLLYQAAWNQLHPEHRIQGVIYNIVAAQPRKKDGAVGTREFFHRGEAEEAVAMNLLRSVIAEQRMQEQLGLWPMSPSKDCNWDCDYVGMCLGVRAGASVDEYIASGEFVQKQRDR